MTMHECPICSHDELGVVEYSMSVPMGRRKVSVNGFFKTRCGRCNFEFITAEQSIHNRNVLLERSSNSRAGVYPGLLRSIREKWDLTQRQLSRMLGAGTSAVGKWEAGGSMSGPSALLAQCAANVPGTVEFLAHLSKTTLTPQKEDADTDTIRLQPSTFARKSAPRHQFAYRSASNASTYHAGMNEVFEEALAA